MDNGIVLPISVEDNASDKFDKMAKNGQKATKSLEDAFSNAFSKKWNNLLGGEALGNTAFAIGKKLMSGVANGIKAGIDIANEMTPMIGKLRMALDEGSSVNEALGRIEQAAYRARMPMEDMTDAVANFGLTTGQYFKNNELIQFTETLAEYASLTAQNPTQALSNSMYQLQQAFSKGRMQMDDLKPIMNQLPGIGNELASALGVSLSELQEMTSAGKFSAAKIKEAFLGMSETVQGKLAQMPMTLEQRMNGIRNALFGMKKAIANVFQAIGESKAFQVVLGGIELTIKRLVAMFNTFASVIQKHFGTAKDQTEDLSKAIKIFSNIALILFGVLAVALTMLTVKLIIFSAQALVAGVQGVLAFLGIQMSILPIIGIILGVILVVVALIQIFNYLGITFGDVCEFIGKVLGGTVAFVWDLFLGLFDFILGIVNSLGRIWTGWANFFRNLFNDPIASVTYLFRDFVNNILNMLKTVAKVIDNIFGTNLASGVQGWMNSVSKFADKVAKTYGNGKYEGEEWKDITSESFGLKRASVTEWANKGGQFGRDLGEGLVGAVTELKNYFGNDLTGLGKESTLNDYDSSTGTGSLSTKLDQSSIDELKAFAEIQYRLNYKHITPNVNIKFGDIRETADLDDITRYIKKIMNEDLEELYILEEE